MKVYFFLFMKIMLAIIMNMQKTVVIILFSALIKISNNYYFPIVEYIRQILLETCNGKK